MGISRSSVSKGVLLATTATIFSMGAIKPSHAYQYTFNNGVTVEIQNTAQYTVLERTAPVSQAIISNVNGNDGDQNLAAGIVSNRFDLISKFNISYQNYGFDVSADSFYDTVYNQKTQNNSYNTYNPASTPPRTTPQTRPTNRCPARGKWWKPDSATYCLWHRADSCCCWQPDPGLQSRC